MEKIQMKTPLVEMDGDEMTRVLWRMIKDELICPFVDLKTEYYDLGLLHRNETRDQVTVDAALATRKYGVAVKCCANRVAYLYFQVDAFVHSAETPAITVGRGYITHGGHAEVA